MEKIYVEKLNNGKSKSALKGRGILITSILMLVVAISMFVTAGFGQDSYAVDLSGATSIKFGATNFKMRATTADGIYFTPLYYVMADGTKVDPVFCLDETAAVEENREYSKGESITDNGLLYLLNKWNNGIDISNYDGDGAKEIKTWILQNAVWIYQHRQGIVTMRPTAVAAICSNNCTGNSGFVKPVSKLEYMEDATEVEATYTTTGISTIVEGLVKEAEANKTSYASFELKSDSDKYTKTDDGKYFISSGIYADSKGTFNGYTAKIVTDIEGAELIDGNGQKITETTLINGGSSNKIYIKVPAASLKENDDNKIKIEANGTFNVLSGFTYVLKDFQTITDVNTNTVPRNTSIEIPFRVDVPTEDTGMTTAQTIYFVGLVVLLCGVGIVYANVKPKEAE